MSCVEKDFVKVRVASSHFSIQSRCGFMPMPSEDAIANQRQGLTRRVFINS